MNTPLSSLAMVALVLAVAPGCQSTRASRIQENPALFASLDPFTQKLIKEGLVNFGFTPDLVYMALGKPSRVTLKETRDGPVITWIYKNFVWGSVAAMEVGSYTPGTRYTGPMMSSASPGSSSLNSKSGPLQSTPDLNDDKAIGTLYVEMFDGRVVAAHVKGMAAH